jgi:hypothetical protein
MYQRNISENIFSVMKMKAKISNINGVMAYGSAIMA